MAKPSIDLELTVLGASGAIGGAPKAISPLVYQELLIGAGMGLCDLSVEALSRIDQCCFPILT